MSSVVVWLSGRFLCGHWIAQALPPLLSSSSSDYYDLIQSRHCTTLQLSLSEKVSWQWKCLLVVPSTAQKAAVWQRIIMQLRPMIGSLLLLLLFARLFGRAVVVVNGSEWWWMARPDGHCQSECVCVTVPAPVSTSTLNWREGTQWKKCLSLLKHSLSLTHSAVAVQWPFNL